MAKKTKETKGANELIKETSTFEQNPNTVIGTTTFEEVAKQVFGVNDNLAKDIASEIPTPTPKDVNSLTMYRIKRSMLTHNINNLLQDSELFVDTNPHIDSKIYNANIFEIISKTIKLAGKVYPAADFNIVQKLVDKLKGYDYVNIVG